MARFASPLVVVERSPIFQVVVDLPPPRAWTYDPAHWSLLLPEAAAASLIDTAPPTPTADGSSA